MLILLLSLLNSLLLSLVLSNPALAVENLIAPAPQAKHITRLDNINLGEVYQVMQSKSGFIWLATLEGLIRFDGYNAKRYVHNPDDPHSISHDMVMGLAEDNKGNLWVSTLGGGLNKFDPRTEQFTPINLRLGPDDKSVSEFLYYLTIDKDNILWVGGAKGLKRVDLNTEQVTPLPGALAELPDSVVGLVFIDSKQQLWIATNYHGVYRYGPLGLQQFAYAEHSPDTLGSNKVRTMNEDAQGDIWVSTSTGLHLFNPAANNFKRFMPHDDPKMSNFGNDIFAIEPDNRGRLWLGTVNTGVLTFIPKTQQFSAISGQTDIHQQFKQTRINHIFTDRDNTLWFSTAQGVIQLSQTARRFDYLSNANGSLKVTDIEQLHSGQVAAAANHEFYHIDLDSPSGQIRPNQPDWLYRITQGHQQDEQQKLWLASVVDGVHYFAPGPSPEQNQQISYRHAKTQSAGVDYTKIYDIFVDDSNQVWVLLMTDAPHTEGGIVMLNPDSETYGKVLFETMFSDILQVADNQLLLASDSVGLYSLNTQTQVVTPWKDTVPTTPKRISAAFKDSRGNLWLGTQGTGLALFEPDKQQFVFYTSSDGLLSNNIVSIGEDNNGLLWLGTPIGLTRFDPDSKQVLNIEQQDGLQFAKFYRRSALKTRDGRMVMGSNAGLVWFDPNDFRQTKPPAKAVINDFKLFNQSVALKNRDPLSPLETPIEFSDGLTLTHRDYVFSFSFSVPEYIRPDKIQFAYKMVGLDDKWLVTDSNNRVASYTTLPAGDYVFNVKASNAQGQWHDTPTTINITILPPWWLSAPAYLFYLLTAIALIYGFVLKRTEKLKLQASELEHKVEERTRELEQSRDQVMHQAQTVSDLLAQKQQLFASVSHEFRTPLTLILSPIDYLLSDPKGQPIHKELSLIKRSSRRLLRMVDQLLEFAKLEQLGHQQDNQTERVSLSNTLGLIVASFESLVKSKHISLTVPSFTDVTLDLLPDSLNKMLINLLSNAFKYSPEHSQITVTVATEGQMVSIAIKDTGIGISETDQQAIFERFNRATHHHGEAIAGAGIGLALVKELAEAHQGQISLTSQLGRGSTFTITLPLANLAHQLPTEASDMSPMLQEHLALELDSISPEVTNRAIDNTNNNVDNGSDDENHKKLILIIDDNADMRDLLHDQLSPQYHCLCGENGQVGLLIAREQLPDLVISDVMMPVMDGYELTGQLKNDPLTSHIPVILLTAKGSVESRIKGLQLLVDDYLAKPFNIEELKLRIYNILTIRDILAQRFSQAVDAPQPKQQLEKLHLTAVEQKFFDQLSQQLETHYTDAELNAKMLSELLFINEKQLQRKLKALLGIGFSEWVRNFRLNKASELLLEGHRASQIYYEVGFSSHSYFSSCFKAKFGVTPKKYQTQPMDR